MLCTWFERVMWEKREREREILRLEGDIWFWEREREREREREKKMSFVRVEEVGASHLQIILTSKPYLLILGCLYICIYRY